MARINVDEALFVDPKIIFLTSKIGLQKAIGTWVVLARVAQKYHVDGLPIPEEEIDFLELEAEVFRSKIITKEKNGYMFCNDEQFDWLRKRKEAGRKGGKQTQAKQSKAKQTQSKDKPLTLSLTLTQTNELNDLYKDVMNYLNKKTGSKIDPNGDTHKKLVKHWFDKNYSLKDFKHVIDVKFQEWGDSDQMKKFTKRPKTLFGRSHFEDYLSQELEVSEADSAFDYLADLQGGME